MGLVKPIKEIVRQQMEDGASAAQKLFRQAIRPIYGVDRASRPEHIGSSFLLEYKGLKYLITAAHVLDHSEHTSLLVGGNLPGNDPNYV